MLAQLKLEKGQTFVYGKAFFGVKPEMVCIGGIISSAQMGDPNASIPTPQPVHSRNMFGGYGKSIIKNSVTFVSAASIENNIKDKFELSQRN